MSLARRLARQLHGSARKEDGAITILALYILAATLLASAFAVDFAYLQSARTQLQVAADSAAHAALYYRERHSPEEAKARAVELASHDMPAASYGAVLRSQDVEFGTWSYQDRTFTPDPNSVSAVRVRPSRSEAMGNPVKTYLFKLLNHEEWDIVTEAVFVIFQPPCLREGFVADGVVDIQSNNGFSNGFCVHSNSYVSLNSNNTFEPGTVVSMPDISELDLPKSGFETNEGLQIALRRGYYRLRVLNKIDEIYDDLQAGYGPHVPDYVSGVTIPLSGSKFTADDFTEHRIHRITCTANKVTIEPDTHLKNVVVMTDCQVFFGQGVLLENVVFYNDSQHDKSFTAPSGLSIGLNDHCATGGGAQLVTRGGVDVAADLQIYGGQIIALGNIEFSANANGIQGASLVSAHEISGTSNMDMGFCGSGMEGNFEAPYFRLAL